MQSHIKAFIATTAIFFSCQSLADSGCSFSEENTGFIATCSEEKEEVIITGDVNAQQLVTELPEFSEGYKSYQVDTASIAPIKAVTTPTEIVVIIGTWCPDCHRETPRFIRIMEEVNNPNIKVSYIGVDREKKDQEGLAEKYEFTRIPTFIVTQAGKEIGRIVESPKASLEKDLAEILK